MKLKSFSKIKETGGRFLFIKEFNRDTNPRALKNLKDAVRKAEGYLNPIQVLPVSSYRKFYPESILVDPENNRQEIQRKDEKDSDYLVLDGQHRLSVHLDLLKEQEKSKESLAFDLPVQEIALPEGMDPHMYIYTLNTTGTQWNDKDRTKFILASTPTETTGLKVANKWQKEYGLGIRNATAIIQLNDGYRTSMQKTFMDKKVLDPFLKSTPENIERGEKIFRSLLVGFQKRPKMVKNMAPILAIIEIYGATPDENKAEVIDEICVFFKTLKEKDVNRIYDLGSKTERQKDLVCLWKTFKEDLDSDNSFQEKMKAEAIRREEEFTRESEAPKKQTSKGGKKYE